MHRRGQGGAEGCDDSTRPRSLFLVIPAHATALGSG